MARIVIVAAIVGVTAGLVYADDGQDCCDPYCGDCCWSYSHPSTACWYYWCFGPRLCGPCGPCGYWNRWTCPDPWWCCRPTCPQPDDCDDDTPDTTDPDITIPDTDQPM